MSLNYHVKNEDDILDGMLNVVYTEFSTPDAGELWRRASQRCACRPVSDTCKEFPAALTLLWGILGWSVPRQRCRET